jgi:nicotinate phosphoribosyltransferase
MGTAAHAWTLLHDTEEAFRSQIELSAPTRRCSSTPTTSAPASRRRARRRHGARRRAHRLRRPADGRRRGARAARRARRDRHRITVTSDLDEFAIAALAASPWTPTGSAPRSSPDRALRRRNGLQARRTPGCRCWVAVAKASTDKASTGGRKAAFRTLERGTATSELIAVSDGFERGYREEHPDARPLQVTLVENGEPDAAYEAPRVAQARAHHALVRELPVTALALSRSDPALPTVYVDAAG